MSLEKFKMHRGGTKSFKLYNVDGIEEEFKFYPLRVKDIPLFFTSLLSVIKIDKQGNYDLNLNGLNNEVINDLIEIMRETVKRAYPRGEQEDKEDYNKAIDDFCAFHFVDLLQILIELSGITMRTSREDKLKQSIKHQRELMKQKEANK
ncbi:MAG: hypothetical protein ACTSQY_01010 [Candidatus Odinarchaeia archaeon]